MTKIVLRSHSGQVSDWRRERIAKVAAMRRGGRSIGFIRTVLAVSRTTVVDDLALAGLLGLPTEVEER